MEIKMIQPYNFKDLKEFYDKNADEDYPLEFSQELFGEFLKEYFFAMKDDDGKIVGVFGIHGIRSHPQSLGHFTFVVDKDERGKGYGKDILIYAIRIGFEQLNLRKLVATVAESNEISKHILGEYMGIEGKLIQYDMYRGQYEDHYQYYILNSEYQEEENDK